jgi:hypothetical protein
MIRTWSSSIVDVFAALNNESIPVIHGEGRIVAIRPIPMFLGGSQQMAVFIGPRRFDHHQVVKVLERTNPEVLRTFVAATDKASIRLFSDGLVEQFDQLVKASKMTLRMLAWASLSPKEREQFRLD